MKILKVNANILSNEKSYWSTNVFWMMLCVTQFELNILKIAMFYTFKCWLMLISWRSYLNFCWLQQLISYRCKPGALLVSLVFKDFICNRLTQWHPDKQRKMSRPRVKKYNHIINTKCKTQFIISKTGILSHLYTLNFTFCNNYCMLNGYQLITNISVALLGYRQQNLSNGIL